MNKKTKVAYIFAIVLALAVSFASLAAIAKNDGSNKGGNSKKSSQSKEKSKKTDLKNYQKPDKSKGETNAQIHKEKRVEVVENLEEVANKEETVGNIEVSNQIQEVAKEQEQAQEQTAEAIEQVETRGKVKTFLVGTDYKNLGQLRSELVHNRNQIRKLTQTMNQVQNSGDATLLQQQLETLMQERERIKTFITDNENSFSLFGWVSRFLNDYDLNQINEQEENELTEEVEETIENVEANTSNTDTDDTTTPSVEPAVVQ